MLRKFVVIGAFGMLTACLPPPEASSPSTVPATDELALEPPPAPPREIPRAAAPELAPKPVEPPPKPDATAKPVEPPPKPVAAAKPVEPPPKPVAVASKPADPPAEKAETAAAPAPKPVVPVVAVAPATGGPKGSITGQLTTLPVTAAKNAVIYLEDGPSDKPINATLDNHGMAFVPYVVVVNTLGKFTVTNTDPFPHNAFSPDNEKWDLGVLASKGSKTRRFEKAGVYTVLCNMHPNMKAYVVVVPSSYYAKADKDGAYSIADVPAGTYHVTAWAPGVKPSTQSVTVNGEVSVNFDLRR